MYKNRYKAKFGLKDIGRGAATVIRDLTDPHRNFFDRLGDVGAGLIAKATGNSYNDAKIDYRINKAKQKVARPIGNGVGIIEHVDRPHEVVKLSPKAPAYARYSAVPGGNAAKTSQVIEKFRELPKVNLNKLDPAFNNPRMGYRVTNMSEVDDIARRGHTSVEHGKNELIDYINSQENGIRSVLTREKNGIKSPGLMSKVAMDPETGNLTMGYAHNHGVLGAQRGSLFYKKDTHSPGEVVLRFDGTGTTIRNGWHKQYSKPKPFMSNHVRKVNRRPQDPVYHALALRPQDTPLRADQLDYVIRNADGTYSYRPIWFNKNHNITLK